MGVAREFLGWEGPLLERVAGYLGKGWDGGGVWDLSGTLVVVPTRNSGRRLREYLAGYAAEAGGGGVVPPRVMSPEEVMLELGMGEEDRDRVAGGIEGLLAWVRVLLRCEPEEYSALFPVPPEERSFRWALVTAREFQKLRKLLGEEGLMVGEAKRRFGPEYEEAARWEDLARLEGWYLKELEGQGRVDVEAALQRGVGAPTVPEGVERIVVAGVADALPMVVKMLEAASARVPVSVLVYAPETMGDRFDEWGRPLAGAWGHEKAALPIVDEDLEVCGRPPAQARRVIELVRGAERPGEGLTLGVLDAQVLRFLERGLEEVGVKTFDPEGVSLGAQGFAHFMRSLLAFVRSGKYADYLRLLRCPDFLLWVERGHGVVTRSRSHLREASGRGVGATGRGFEAAGVLKGFDDFLADALPDDFETGVGRMQAMCGEKLTGEVKAGIRAGRKVLEVFGSGALTEVLPGLLEEIYGGRELGAEISLSDRAIEAGAARVVSAMREMGGGLAEGLSNGEAFELVLGALEGERLYLEAEPGAVALQGWMELLWDDAPNLILSGMNEGLVPEAVVGDGFLPDSVRKRLGLKDNEQRFARDAYLLGALLHWRQANGGKVRVTIGKSGPDNEPMRPSRLLFLCPDEALVARCDRLFAKVRERGANVPWSAAWKLKPAVDEERVAEVLARGISVTDFRGYLACPFRFYLRKFRRMEEAEPGKVEMNPMDFGNVLHAVLEELEGEAVVGEAGDEKGLEELLMEELDRRVGKRFGVELSVPLIIQVEAARQRLRAAAAAQVRAWEEGWVIEHAEWKIHEELPGWKMEGVPIRGVIDRVERRGREVRVLDYKTADEGKNPKSEHYAAVSARTNAGSVPAAALFELGGRAHRWKDMQLPLYCLAARQLYPDATDISCGYFNLPKAVEATGIVPLPVTDELLGEAERCAGEVVRTIVEGRFWPPVERVKYGEFGELMFDVPEETIDPEEIGDWRSEIGDAESETGDGRLKMGD